MGFLDDEKTDETLVTIVPAPEEPKPSNLDKVLEFMSAHPFLTFFLASLILNFIVAMTNAICGTNIPHIKSGP